MSAVLGQSVDTNFYNQTSKGSHRMLNARTEFNRYAERRMREEFKPIHEIAERWGREVRETCGPGDIRSNAGKIIDQTPWGASQQGAPTPDAEYDVTVMDRCVAKLKPIQRIVFEVEYAWCFGKDIGVKLDWLKRNRKIHMSRHAFKHRLMLDRELILILFPVMYEKV